MTRDLVPLARDVAGIFGGDLDLLGDLGRDLRGRTAQPAHVGKRHTRAAQEVEKRSVALELQLLYKYLIFS